MTGAPGTQFERALALTEQGFRVLPVHWCVDGDCSCQTTQGFSSGRCASNPNSRAKHPLTARGVKDATTDEDTIRSWFERWPKANIGIATGGYPDGRFLVVLDPDRKGGCDGFATLHALAERHNAPTPLDTHTVSTPSGGGHLYFWSEVPVSGSQARSDLPGLDWRGEGGYVLAPGSETPAGYYELRRTGIAELPSFVLDALGTRDVEKPGKRTTLTRSTRSWGGELGVLAIVIHEGPADTFSVAAEVKA